MIISHTPKPCNALLTAEAIPNSTKSLHALLLKRSDDLVKRRACLFSTVLCEPCLNIKLASRSESVGWQSIAIEVVRDDGLQIVLSIRSSGILRDPSVLTLKPFSANESARSCRYEQKSSVNKGFSMPGKMTHQIVGQWETKDVGEEEYDFLLGVVTRRCGDITLDASNLLELASWLALVDDTCM